MHILYWVKQAVPIAFLEKHALMALSKDSSVKAVSKEQASTKEECRYVPSHHDDNKQEERKRR